MQHPLLRPTFTDELEDLVRQAARFNVSLGFAKGFDLERSQVLKICSSVVKPLCAGSDEVLVYGQEDTPVFRRFAANVERYRGKYRLLKGRDPVTGFEDYWGAYRGERGTVVFSVRSGDGGFRRVMENAQDPGFLANPAVIASTSALRYAKSQASRLEEAVVYVLSENQGLETLFVFAHPRRILRWLEVALAHCELTPRYLGLYGKGR